MARIFSPEGCRKKTIRRTSQEVAVPEGRSNRPGHRRRKAANSEPYDVNYFASKHDISREQARQLMREVGRDRKKLNEAAAKLFRK